MTGRPEDTALALRALSEAFIKHKPGDSLLDEISNVVHTLTERISREPVRAQASLGELAEKMRGPVTAIGQSVRHDEYCMVAGALSPIRVGLSLVATDTGVEGTVSISPLYAGPTGNAHGGAIASILDDSISHASGAISIPAVTAELHVSYLQPVPVGRSLNVKAAISDHLDRSLSGNAQITDDNGSILAVATGRLVEVGEVDPEK